MDQDDLSQALKNMAQSPPAPPDPGNTPETPNTPQTPSIPPLAEGILDEPQSPDVAGLAASLAGPSAASSRGGVSRLQKKPSQGSSLKATAVPILLTFGLLMLIPAIWSVLLLAGKQAWGSDRSDAQSMAKWMLASWPVAMALLGAGIYYLMQVLKDQNRS